MVVPELQDGTPNGSANTPGRRLGRRRGVLYALAVAATAVGIGFGAASSAQTPAAQPNVVVILTDDQPTGMLKRMPFLRSAPGFTRFVNYFDNNPLCCPTRATLLSGLYSHHTGIETNLVAGDFDASSTLATWFEDNGYQTGLFGKYMNDYPWNKGATYVPPGWTSWAAFKGDAAYYDYTLISPEGWRRYGNQANDYSTDVLAKLAERFIEDADQPFLLWFTPYGPHSPRTPAPRDKGAYKNTGVKLPPNFNRTAKDSPPYWKHLPRVTPREARKDTRGQWETLLSVDDAVERFFDVLRRTGELDNTIVIVASDNGYSLGSHRNRQKDCPYEECIHLPLLMRWPGAQTVPKVGATVGAMDIAPTIAEMAGTSIPTEVDGTSLVPLLTGAASSLDRSGVLLRHKHYPRTAPSFWGIRTDRWMYATYSDGSKELYDVRRDPAELRNLARRARFQDTKKQLIAQMKALRGG